MTTLVSGNFKQQSDASQAMADLAGAGFAPDLTTTFYVNPPGQHDLRPLGGDEENSAGTAHAGAGAAAGATAGGLIGAVVGLTTLPLLGPGAAVAAAGVGAYVGSLYGALGKMDEDDDPETIAANAALSRDQPLRQSGMLVAVSAPETTQRDTAIRILRRLGATDIEQPEGTIVAGEWHDFNPLTPLRLVTI